MKFEVCIYLVDDDIIVEKSADKVELRSDVRVLEMVSGSRSIYIPIERIDYYTCKEVEDV